jgi:hypothetical protein
MLAGTGGGGFKFIFALVPETSWLATESDVLMQEWDKL